jgi:predicted RNA-binding Zn ribbon-like protein
MDFTFVSGHAALDLAGTVGHRDSADRYDLLREPASVGHWLVEAGLLDRSPSVDRAGLAATVALREAVHRLARARVDGAREDPADLAELNRAARPAPIAVHLWADGEGAEGGSGRVGRDGDLTAALSTLARAAVELLGGPDAARLRACDSDPCTRLFVDSSRRGARRWCDMRECGNRAKAAAYRVRHAP